MKQTNRTTAGAFAAVALVLVATVGTHHRAAGDPVSLAGTRLGRASKATATMDQTNVAFVTNNPSDYWTIARKGTDQACKEDSDVHVDFIMPDDGTAATQKEDVEAALASGAKAIGISPVDPKNQTDWLNEIAARVPLITFDSDAPKSNRLMYIGTDNHAAGLQAGELIKEALPRGGKIEVFVGMITAQNAKDRLQGIEDALKGSDIRIIAVKEDYADHATALQNAEDALAKHPDLAAEVGLWSYNGPTILSAVQNAGKIGKVKIICFDEETAVLNGIKTGEVTGTIVQQPYQFGYLSVKVLSSLAHGDKSVVPANGLSYVPTLIINKGNVHEYIQKSTALREQP